MPHSEPLDDHYQAFKMVWEQTGCWLVWVIENPSRGVVYTVAVVASNGFMNLRLSHHDRSRPANSRHLSAAGGAMNRVAQRYCSAEPSGRRETQLMRGDPT